MPASMNGVSALKGTPTMRDASICTRSTQLAVRSPPSEALKSGQVSSWSSKDATSRAKGLSSTAHVARRCGKRAPSRSLSFERTRVRMPAAPRMGAS
eukprot:5585848-Prymnesium_polylepis.1